MRSVPLGIRSVLIVGLGTLLVAGCTGSPINREEQRPTRALLVLPEGATTVVDAASAADLALATSRALFESAPAVVLVGEEDGVDAVDLAAQVATAHGIPVLVTPAVSAQPTGSANPSATTVAPAGAQTGVPAGSADLLAEIQRLAVWQVITAGEGAAGWVNTASLPGTVQVSTVDGAPRDVTPGDPLESLLVLAVGTPLDAAAVATARASGARVLALGASDPRATSATVEAVAGEASIDRVLALGSAFGTPERLRQRLATAATGVQLPGGGQVVFPGRRMVALYGHPGDGGLGVLGEQDISASIQRAQELAAEYEGLVDEPFIPAFEIIVTVASSSAGTDGNYSNEFSIDKFRPWIEAARDAGIYVLLDLQPGRSDFLSQARLYEELLLYPNVGLALDPEWRLKPGQVHMVQIGSVTAAEINETGAWLADLVRTHNLPQKVLMLHQFQLRMIENRSTLVTDYDELRVVIHADGFGSPGAKRDTWNALHIDEPANVLWGWKNFYDEDTPTFTPAQTMAVAPDEIVFVSYQ